MSEPRRGVIGRGRLIAVLAIGLGLALAPAVFQMFTRAPGGGRMIDDFKPHMSETRLAGFRDDLALVTAASAEQNLVSSSGLEVPPAVSELQQKWPAIEDEMVGMVRTIEGNVHRFRGLVALPPFWAFPWFFVIPGLAIAGVVAVGLRGGAIGGQAIRRTLVVLGVSLIAAPVVFQMFTRAPGGARMIDDFRPLMTEARIAAIQGHFLVLASAEGELRTVVVPAAAAKGTELPATAAFIREWPRMAGDMAPMIGAMSDNLDNFAGVAALPPFWLFPWFFVLPGPLVGGLALARPLPRVAPVQATPLLERSTS